MAETLNGFALWSNGYGEDSGASFDSAVLGALQRGTIKAMCNTQQALAALEKLYESRVFDFRGHGFDEDVMKGLCQVLCIEGLTYTNVDLRGNKLSEEDATQLSSAIVKHASLPNPTLVRFNGIHLYAIRNMNMNEDYQLGFQNVGDVGCMVLAGLLKYRWKLNPMPILLRGNGITQLGAGALMEAIASSTGIA